MPRVTKSVTAKAKHKKILKATKGHYGAEVDYLRPLQSTNTNMHLEMKIKKELSDHCGLQE